MGVGRLVSTINWSFSGSMLIFQRVFAVQFLHKGSDSFGQAPIAAIHPFWWIPFLSYFAAYSHRLYRTRCPLPPLRCSATCLVWLFVLYEGAVLTTLGLARHDEGLARRIIARSNGSHSDQHHNDYDSIMTIIDESSTSQPTSFTPVNWTQLNPTTSV